MSKTIHINQARAMLDTGQPVRLTVVKKNGGVMTIDNAVSLSYDVYTGMRSIKVLQSNQIRSIRDCLIIGVNEQEVFL